MKGKEQRWKQRKQKKNRGMWRGSENSNVFIEKITIPQVRTLRVSEKKRKMELLSDRY